MMGLRLSPPINSSRRFRLGEEKKPSFSIYARSRRTLLRLTSVRQNRRPRVFYVSYNEVAPKRSGAHRGAVRTGPQPSTCRARQAKIRYEIEKAYEGGLLTLILSTVLPMVLVVLLFFPMMRQLQAGGGRR